MGSTAPQVGIIGMAALRRDLKRQTDEVSSPLYAAIKAAGKTAAEPIAARTRSTVPSSSGRMAGNVRTSGTRTGAAVRMGSAKVPYAPWIDFGGTRPDGSSREYVGAGRYLFPAAADLAGRAAELYSSAIDAALNGAGVWTNTTNDGGAVHD
jgi:hypothetical protein